MHRNILSIECGIRGTELNKYKYRNIIWIKETKIKVTNGREGGSEVTEHDLVTIEITLQFIQHQKKK